jgi:uncharacterized protein (DUF362 family)
MAMITRRTFIKTAAAAGASIALRPLSALGGTAETATAGFGVHPFVDSHPDAVFIMRTSVDLKTNAAAIKQAGLSFGRSVFISQDVEAGGIPLTRDIAIKPNLTCRRSSDSRYTVEGTMGIVTDSSFVEGVIESLKELGLPGSRFYIREVSCPVDFSDSGYTAMAQRTGAELRDLSAKVGVISEADLQWIDVPAGVWFRRIPYLRPVNSSANWLLNIAKLKAHGMGITLCAKNLQGAIAHNYQAHCTAYSGTMDMATADISPTAKADILVNYNRHVAAGIPRWDRPGADGGLWQETWATRCLDNNSVTHPGLHVIEGVYGRDGNFIDGPSPEGLATDYMMNVILFGKNPFYVDNIGHWLAGHEPGNFGLFHLAIERGLASVLNPRRIPVYEWQADGTATLTALTSFQRTPLETYYLQRNYDGQSEPYWHLVNEPYDYGTVGVDPPRAGPSAAFGVRQISPNPAHGLASIEFDVPKAGGVRLEVCNIVGEVVEVLVDGYRLQGAHLAVWNATRRPPGIYFCRLLSGGASAAKKMILIR